MADSTIDTTFHPEAYLGRWRNFELYFTDPDARMQAAWDEAERVTRERRKDLLSRYLFRHGAKRFWMDACYTQTSENPVRLGGWEVTSDAPATLHILWTGEDGQALAEDDYTLDTTLPKGLEGKPNHLLRAQTLPSTSPFRYLLLMPPMPERSAKEHGGLISHLHFQYASDKEELIRGDRLRKTHWYATMCDADVTKEQECEIVRALHAPKEST